MLCLVFCSSLALKFLLKLSRNLYLNLTLLSIELHPRVYDVDGNGVVGREEMAKILRVIREMLAQYNTTSSTEEMVQEIFSKLDKNSDDRLTEEEFVSGVLQDEGISKMLAQVVQ